MAVTLVFLLNILQTDVLFLSYFQVLYGAVSK